MKIMLKDVNPVDILLNNNIKSNKYISGPGITFNFLKDYYKNKKIKLPKKIIDYLEIRKIDYSVEDIRNALIDKSENNKKLLSDDKIKNSYPKTTIYLDKKGKELFNVKPNFIMVDCLIDLLVNDFSLEIPNCDYFDYNQEPIEITEIKIEV